MKLSEKQKEVIRHMRKGNHMFKNVTYITLIGGNGCRQRTFYSLLNNGIIKYVGRFKRGRGTKCILTKLGHIIEL